MAEHPWRKLWYLAWNKSNGRLLYEDCSKTRDRKVDLKSVIFSLEQCICKLLAKYRRLRRICMKRLFHLLLCLMADLTSIFRPYLTQLWTPKIYPSGIMMDPVLDRLLERTVKSSFSKFLLPVIPSRYVSYISLDRNLSCIRFLWNQPSGYLQGSIPQGEQHLGERLSH